MHSSNQTSNKPESLSRGFTIVELILVIAISGILIVSLVSFISSMTKQFGITSARNAQTTQLSLATDRLDNDIKGATAVLNYSPVDPSGPSGMPWQTSTNRLVLSTAARDSSDEPIPGSNGYATDTIIYYLKDGSLYRRLLPANYAGNRYTPKNCSATPSGGCASDTKITDNVQSITFFYYAKDTGASLTPVTPPIATGNVTTVKFKLTLTRQQSGQTISTESNTTSLLGNKQPEEYSLNGRFIVGPGGLNAYGSTFINGSVNIMGQGEFGNNTSIGTSTNPITLNVSNLGCTVGSTWPSSCAPDQPLKGYVPGYKIYGDVCAADQISATNVIPASGFTPNCTPPPTIFPVFNKQAFVNKMTNTATPPPCGYNTVRTLAANTTYTADDVTVNCKSTTLNGSIYVKGKINWVNTVLIMPEHLTERPKIVVNDSITFHSVVIVPNDRGIVPDFISFKASNSVCSSSPNCTSLSSAERKASTGITAIQTTGITKTAGVSYYAYFGTADMYNSITGPVAAQRVVYSFSDANLSY